MPVRPVVVLPDPVLTRPSEPVVRVGDFERALASDLVETMRVSPGCVGLAAPQIGVGARVFVMDVTGHPKTTTCHGLVICFNPVLIWQDDPVTMREGCMSVPDLTGNVTRSSRVSLKGIGLDGEEVSILTDGFEARAVLHEIDHLDGHVFLDRVSGPHAVFKRKVYR